MSDQPKLFAQKATKPPTYAQKVKVPTLDKHQNFDIIERIILPVLGVIFILDCFYAAFCLLLK